MTITGETKAELRRLQQAARDARARYDAVLAGNAADEVRSEAVREAYESDLEFRKAIDCVGIGALLDALAAAEAERDRLRGFIEAILDADERGQGLPFSEAMKRAYKHLHGEPR